MHLGKEDLFQEERSKLNHLPPSSFLSTLLQTTLAGSVVFVRRLPKVFNDVRSQMHLHQNCRVGITPCITTPGHWVNLMPESLVGRADVHVTDVGSSTVVYRIFQTMLSVLIITEAHFDHFRRSERTL